MMARRRSGANGGEVPPAVARLVRWVLPLYPSTLRSRHGEEMTAFLADEYRDAAAGASRWAAASFLVGRGLRLALQGLAARAESLRRLRSGGPAPGGRGGGGGGGLPSLRHAARRLARAPGYSVTSVLTLGLGMGACILIFSAVDAVLLSPLPYPDAQELVTLYERSPGPDGEAGWVSPLTYRDWAERTESLQDLAAWRLSLLTWTGGDEPTVLRGWAVSAGFLPTLGLDMALGRSFTADEDRPGAARVVVLSHGLWTRSFGSDPGVLGQALTLDGEPYTIIGVAGESVSLPGAGAYWTPLALEYGSAFRDFRYLGLVGRLRPGMTLEGAQQEFDGLAQEVAREDPDTNRGWGARIVSLKDDQVGHVRPTLLAMAAAVGLLLLVSLGNVTNLSIARGIDRQGDLALRKALGATRAHLAGNVLAETLLLSLAGGALGAAVAYGGLPPVAAALGSVPGGGAMAVDARSLAFAVVVSVVTGVGLGLAVTFLAGERPLAQTLRGAAAGATGSAGAHRVRAVVLAGQVALALTLVIGGTLLGRSLAAMGRVDVGFDPEGVTSFAYQLPVGSYADDESIRSFYDQALARIRAVPGVQAAGAVTPMPLEMGSVPSSWTLDGGGASATLGTVMAHMRTATPGYPETMGIRLLQGRFLEPSDEGDTPPVVVVNQAFARRYLGGASPLGARIAAGEPDGADTDWWTVVGMVSDVRFRSLTTQSEPEIYISDAQLPTRWGNLVVRAAGSRESVVRAVSDAVHQVDPDLPLSEIRTGAEILDGQLRRSRLTTLLAGLFATTATLLAAVGILGVLSLLVAQRLREIGLRMVLGAPSRQIRWFLVAKGFRPVAVGLALGLALSVYASGTLEGMLRGMVSPRDPLTFVTVTVGFAALGFVACLIPSVRASTADPLTLIRDE